MEALRPISLDVFCADADTLREEKTCVAIFFIASR